MPKSKEPLSVENIQQLQKVGEFFKIQILILKLNPFDNLVYNLGVKR